MGEFAVEETTSKPAYRFDRFTLDLTRGALLSVDGKEIPLRPKSFALLHLLIENAGRLLDHDTIMRAVWPDVTVTDESIVQCVRDIRKALGGGTDGLIKTVPRRGYMFPAAVRIVQKAAAAEPPSMTDKPAVAILPFVNLTMGTGRDNFSERVTDDIITVLSRSHALAVIARHPRDNGGDGDEEQMVCTSGGRYVLSGSVRRDAGRIRVNVRLADLATGTYIWGNWYDRGLDEMICVQGEIAIAASLAVEHAVVSAEQRRALRTREKNLGPWGFYQRGLWHIWQYSPDENDQARRFFQRALRSDTSFAAPYSAMAMVNFNEGVVYGSHPLGESVQAAELWARTAVRLDPDDPDTLATLALTTLVTGRIDESWEQVARALAAVPETPWAMGVSGTIKLYGGNPAEGRALLFKASRSAPHDPRNAILMTQIAISHYHEHAYTDAVAAAKAAVGCYPDYPLTYRWLAAALGQLNRTDQANEMLRKAVDVSPKSFMRYVRDRPPWFRQENHEHMLDGLRKAGWRGQPAS